MKKTNLLVVNFKTYPNTVGDGAKALAKTCVNAAKNTAAQLILCPDTFSVKEIAATAKNSCTIFTQHLDNKTPDKNTGFLTPKHAKAAGAQGTLLNHAEHKISLQALRETLDLCKKTKLTTIVCAANLAELKKIRLFKPDYIAYEPPSLIGGNISVSDANPRIIRKAKELLKGTQIKLLCGAGIKTANDVKEAITLGCSGVLVASGVVTAKNPGKVVADMMKALG